MRVILLAALTADGYIARSADHLATSWTTREDKRLFVSLTKEVGTMIMGQNTFQTIGTGLPGRRLIVLSEQIPEAEETPKGVEFVRANPKELITRLESEGVKGVIICGGAMVYDQYIHSGLINEIYLSIQPVLFGDGMRLFSNEIDQKLHLCDTRTCDDGTVVLHYQPSKSSNTV